MKLRTKSASFAEELFNHFRHDISKLELVPGTKGAFEVEVNGSKLHSKHETGEYPELESVINKMKRMSV